MQIDTQRRAHPAEWVIRDAEYFDPESHEFRKADIEIAGAYISDIKSAGTSGLADGVSAAGYVCTPAVIHPWVDPRTACLIGGSIAGNGVTGLGTICENISDCLLVMSTLRGMPVTVHVRLGDRGRSDLATGFAPDNGVLQRIARRGSLSGITFRPLIDCSQVTSAQELVDAAAVATRLGAGLGVALGGAYEEARDFRERFYCSEIELLSFLGLLDATACLFVSTPLGRRDLDLVEKSGASLVCPYGLRGGSRGARVRRARMALECGLGPSPYIGLCAPRWPEALDQDGGDAEANQLVDGMTMNAARALGMTDRGTIAPGMRADICLFSWRPAHIPHSGSRGFLQLHASQRPDAVLFQGIWRAGLRRPPDAHTERRRRVNAAVPGAAQRYVRDPGAQAVSP